MAWFDVAWTRRKALTFDRTKSGSSTLAGFPAMVDVTDAAVRAGARGDMRDIVFTASDGTTQLAHERIDRRAIVPGVWSRSNLARAVYLAAYKTTYFGTLNTSGDILVGSYNHASGAIAQTTLKTAIESLDDHDSPALLALDDGRLVAFYSRHGADTTMYYRLTTNAGDISAWDAEQSFTSTDLVTYPKAHKCGSYYYLFYRSGTAYTRYRRTTDFVTWSAEAVVVQQATVGRPYVTTCKNGANRIDVLYVERHPNEGASSARHMYMLDTAGTVSWHKSDGTTIAGTPMTGDGTLLHDASTLDAIDQDIMPDGSGNPAVIYGVYDGTVANIDYVHRRWNGSAWTSPVTIATAPMFSTGQFDNIPGICFDGNTVDTVYLSQKVGAAYEIQEWGTADSGATWTKTRDVTSGGTGTTYKQFRPCSAIGHVSKPGVMWMTGKWTSYTSFDLWVGMDPPAATRMYVKVPSLAGSGDPLNTTIYCYYGNASAADQQNATAVWDANYKAVLHFGINTTDWTKLYDSTSNARHFTKRNDASPVSVLYNGQIGAKFVHAATDYATATLNMAGWTASSLEAHVTWDADGGSTDRHALFHNVSTTQAGMRWWIVRNSTPTADSQSITVNYSPDNFYGLNTQAPAFTAGEHVAMAFHDTNELGSALDGVKSATTGAGGTMDATASLTAYIGRDPANSWTYGGRMFEFRVSDVKRSIGWHTATTNNLKSPSTFYTWGAEEGAGQTARPATLVDAGGWSYSTTSIPADIGEESVDVNTYVYTTSSSQTCKVRFSVVIDPETGQRKLKFYARSPSGSSVRMSLRNGSTEIEGWTQALNSNFTLYARNVTQAIPDWSVLDLWMTSL